MGIVLEVVYSLFLFFKKKLLAPQVLKLPSHFRLMRSCCKMYCRPKHESWNIWRELYFELANKDNFSSKALF